VADILLIEDNPADVMLTKEAFKECKNVHNVFALKDGIEGINYLNDTSRQGGKLPDLILLDLNLPKKDGREVLKDIKNNALLEHIPVIVLSTSKNELDVLETYSHKANCYISKPVELDDFFFIVSKIEAFWLSDIKFPI
jgi:two-component system, chemotaxis family, response regulator Rcp1